MQAKRVTAVTLTLITVQRHRVRLLKTGQQRVVAGPIGTAAVTADPVHNFGYLPYLVERSDDLFAALDLVFR